MIGIAGVTNAVVRRTAYTVRGTCFYVGAIDTEAHRNGAIASRESIVT